MPASQLGDRTRLSCAIFRQWWGQALDEDFFFFNSGPVSPDNNVLWVVKAGQAELRVQLGEGTRTPRPSHSDLICFLQVSSWLPSAELSSLREALSPSAWKVKATCIFAARFSICTFTRRPGQAWGPRLSLASSLPSGQGPR